VSRVLPYFMSTLNPKRMLMLELMWSNKSCSRSSRSRSLKVA
jgi:hypothetical protein